MVIGNTASDSGLRAQVWSKDLWRDVEDDLFFMRAKMMGSDTNNIVFTMDDLIKTQGDRITVPLTYNLSGNGVTGDNELEGNEEKIQPYSDAVLIDQIRNAVRLTGKLDEKKNAYNMRTDAKNKLKIWLREFIERQIFLKLGSVNNLLLTDVNGAVVGTRSTWSNTPDEVPDADTAAGYGNRYLCADYASGATSLVATDLITPALISRCKTKATQAVPKILPIRTEGKDYYVMFVHPRQMYDLKQNPVFTQAMREAEVRGKNNPLFGLSSAVWDGVIIYEHPYCPYLDIDVALNNFSDDDGGTDYAAVDAYRAILCGQQAVVMAKAQNGVIWDEERFNYGNQTGFATGMIGGIQKVTFNSLDYGIITLDTAATAV